MEQPFILTINPGSTSTKIALFRGLNLEKELVVRHSDTELKQFKSITEQFPFRKKLVVDSILEAGYSLDDIDIIVGRGGLVKPIESGIYEVNRALSTDLRNGVQGSHASNLGGLIAKDIASDCADHVKAYIADPVVVDEMSEIAHVGGNQLFPRRSVFHALNQKAVARLYAEESRTEYEKLNLIVAHMGGGVSVGAHKNGKVIDVNQALDGEGAFSPERSGTLPAGDIIKCCFSGKYTFEQMYRMVVGEGGIYSYLKTTDIKAVVERAKEDDKEAKLIIDAFTYNVAKNIGASAVVLKGEIDAILLTGGIAYSEYICDKIKEQVAFLADVHIYPGEDEMRALAANGLLVWEQKVQAKVYF